MTTITLPRAVVEQALEALEYAQQDRECPSTTRQAIAALRAALAQQAEPLNLRDPAVQKRLAAQWGYVPAAQAEPVEQLAELQAMLRAEVDRLIAAGIQPQRKLVPLTEEEIERIGMKHVTLREVIRAVERAHGIGSSDVGT